MAPFGLVSLLRVRLSAACLVPPAIRRSLAPPFPGNGWAPLRSLRAPLRALAVAAVAAVVLAPLQGLAQDVDPGRSDETITLSGILSGTVFLQDATFGLGNGQQAQFVSDELAGWWHGGDVRNTRVTVGIRGPSVAGDWQSNATVELDFFGGFNGAGNFGDEQPVPRLRLAFVDLTNGRTTFRAGQGWSLTLGQIPVSASHIGFPLGWGTGGFIGWRFPGLWLKHRLSPANARTSLEAEFAVLRGSWVDEEAADGISAGEAGLPQLEGRLNLRGATGDDGRWNAYVVGHFDSKDLNGARPEGTPEPPDDDLDSWAFEAGGNVEAGRVRLQGNAYTGKAMGHHFASLIQFGDIASWGAWGQAGFNLTPRWSVWGYVGFEDPDDDDVAAAALVADADEAVFVRGGGGIESLLFAPMLRYRSGPYQAGLEWLRSRTSYLTPTGETELTGNQLAFSVGYEF